MDKPSFIQLTFDKNVSSVFLSIFSFNLNTIVFNSTYEILSQGPSMEGVSGSSESSTVPCSSYNLNSTSGTCYQLKATGNSELGGTLLFRGIFNSFTFKILNEESWHSFSVNKLYRIILVMFINLF